MLKKVKSGEMAERWSRGGTEGCGVTVRCEECPHLHTSISSKLFICLFQYGCLQYFLLVSTPTHSNIFLFFIAFFWDECHAITTYTTPYFLQQNSEFKEVVYAYKLQCFLCRHILFSAPECKERPGHMSYSNHLQKKSINPVNLPTKKPAHWDDLGNQQWKCLSVLFFCISSVDAAEWSAKLAIVSMY